MRNFNPAKIKGIIFDMDGTLTEPSLDFDLIKKEAGIPMDSDIIETLNSWAMEKREKAWAIIEKHEKKSSKNTVVQNGVKELLSHLREENIRTGLLTRNSSSSVKSFVELIDFEFDCIITRDFPFHKPHPEPVRHMIRKWNIEPEEILVVGDYIHDIECGRAAGANTCFFANPGKTSYSENADISVHSHGELLSLLASSNKKSQRRMP